MNTKNRILISFLGVLIIFYSKSSFAIGELSIGVNLGATYDPNNLMTEINRYNTVMQVNKEENPGTEVSKITVPYSFLWGFNIRYQFNLLLFRLGCHFAKPGSGVKGSITSLGSIKNEIRIATYQNSFPASVGFIVPLKQRTFFYIGGGLTYHQAYIKVTQSYPDQTSTLFAISGLSINMRDRYTEDFPGYHLLVGAEVPMNDKLTISLEWIHQEGRSYPLTNGGIDEDGNVIYTPKRIINVKGDFILFGLNYYISM